MANCGTEGYPMTLAQRAPDLQSVVEVDVSSSHGHEDPAAVFNVGIRLRTAIESYTADPEEIARVIDQAYGHQVDASTSSADASVEDLDDIDHLLAEADRDLLSTQGKGPVVKLIDALLFGALSRSASDVHVQPLVDRTLVRYRLDGVLHTIRE